MLVLQPTDIDDRAGTVGDVFDKLASNTARRVLTKGKKTMSHAEALLQAIRNYEKETGKSVATFRFSSDGDIAET